MSKHNIDRVSFGGLLITLGIIYGDIGTSPLYVMKAISGTGKIEADVVLGGISCVFWTLTLQTTLKYIILTLRADNNGEGGIFSLYTLVRKLSPKLYIPALVGGAALLADGIITPPISISSAVEGLRIFNAEIPTVPITIAIITLIFAFQRLGTNVVGRSFGPIMLIWFTMLAALGLSYLVNDLRPIAAINPYYAWELLALHPNGFWLLGAVFLCTTGAEALYSDLGHCGRGNIRVSWVYVKAALILNYMGQGAWLLEHEGQVLGDRNPFYLLMPDWFLIIGILIATCAAIIASQALISGSFTLVGEAIRLNLFPKVKVVFPSHMKGQLYIPSLNLMLWIGCLGIMLYFRESSAMEAAYGLAITVTMLMTTILLMYYLRLKRYPAFLIFILFVLYTTIEGAFLAANLLKFMHGGFVTVVVALLIGGLMWVWLEAGKIKSGLIEMVKLPNYQAQLKQLSSDEAFPKYATHLVFLSKARRDDEVEEAIMYSILNKQPKRADVYWFVHVEVTDEPDTMSYFVRRYEEDDVYRIHFKLGFRVPQQITSLLRQVITELVGKDEVHISDIARKYNTQPNQKRVGDFKFVILKEILTSENDLPFWKQWVLALHLAVKEFTGGPIRWFGLDSSIVETEPVPLIIRPMIHPKLVRLEDPLGN